MPNRTTPEFWKDDENLNQLPTSARLLFYLLQHVIDDTHRFKIGPEPQKPKLLHAALYALAPSQRVTDTARDLLRLKDAGVISVRDSERGWYGEIAEHMRYRSEDFAKGAPRYGPRQAAVISQPQLPLGPVEVLPAARMKGPKSKPYGYGNDIDPDSNRGNRELSRGEESGARGEAPRERPKSFERSVTTLSSSQVGARLAGFFGFEQMTRESIQSGAFWEGATRDYPEIIDELIDEGLRKKEELKTGETRAKWLTKRLHERMPKQGQG